MDNLLRNAQQLSLFDQPLAAAEELDTVDGAAPDYTYRVARNGDFVVTGTVPGYGRITTRSRWLATAVSEFRARAEAARAAVQELF